jgi:hypothetical protein
MLARTTWRVALAGAAFVTAVLLPTHAATQKKTDAERVVSNLKQIGLALHGYHDTYKQYHRALYSRDKTPLLSWRVAILPWLEEERLFFEFRLNESWDSEHNKKLIAKIPNVYVPVGEGKMDEGHTYYQVFMGRNTLFDGVKKITNAMIMAGDGTANTVLVVEAKNSVVWTKPDDLEMPAADAKVLPVGGLFKDRWHALFCDGSVSTFVNDMPIATLRALITPAGNEPPDFEKYLKK